MELNLIGLTAGLSAFLGIWFGHVVVRKIDFFCPSVGFPAALAVLTGLMVEVVALFSSSVYVTTALGILGMTFLWDAVEFYRQDRRVRSGHAPANPGNPRHARMLAEGGTITIVDLLKREPTGRRVSPDELLGALESDG